MNYIVNLEQLPIPTIYKGGYIQRQESIGLLNGQCLPRSERWSSQPWEKTDKSADCLRLLEASPVGSLYEFKEFSEDGEIEYQRTYRKLDTQQWLALA